MKKVILSMALLAGVVFSSQAQTEQGKIIVGGSVSFETQKDNVPGAKSFEQFQILPNIGYFVADNIVVGTGIGFSSTYPSIYDGTVLEGSKRQEFVVSPFGRYYLPVAEKFYFFGQLAVPLAFGKDKYDGTEFGTTTNIGVNLSPGFAFFPSSKIGVEFAFNGIAYQSDKFEATSGGSITTNSFAVGTNFFAPRIGVQFHF